MQSMEWKNKLVSNLLKTSRKIPMNNIDSANEFLNKILEFTPYPFYIIDANNYEVIVANSAACKDKLPQNIKCYTLTHRRSSPCSAENMSCTLEEVKKNKKPVKIEHIHYDRNGNPRYFEVHGFPIFDNNGKIIQMIEYSVDITERKQAEAALLENVSNFKSIVTTNADAILIIGSSNIIHYLNSTTEIFLGKNADSLLNSKFPFSFSEDKLTEIEITCRNGKPGIGEINSVKTNWGGKGSFVVTIRDVTGRRQVETKLKQSLEKLEKTLEGAVCALALEAEKRDPYTAGHQRRVTHLACAIAKEMGLNEEQIKILRIAGILHDVGKIHIPAEILSKPSRLTDKEFALIKDHPKVGYDIVKIIEYFFPVAQIVLQHQERINGQGYPYGLSGENIVLEARILAVADVVEAMSSHRPYRPALGIEKALEEIIKNKGILYDAKVVEICVLLFQEKGFKFEEIKQDEGE